MSIRHAKAVGFPDVKENPSEPKGSEGIMDNGTGY